MARKKYCKSDGSKIWLLMTFYVCSQYQAEERKWHGRRFKDRRSINLHQIKLASDLALQLSSITSNSDEANKKPQVGSVAQQQPH